MGAARIFDSHAFAGELRNCPSAAHAMAFIEPVTYGDLKRVCRQFGIRVSGLDSLNAVRHTLIRHLFGQ